MPIEPITTGEGLIGVRVNGQAFTCEEETGETIIPKKYLANFRLSEIPADIVIKPVESIEGDTIYRNNDTGLSSFSDGSASAMVEEMFRRKFWDGEIGLSPYVAALRQAIAERDEASETDFQDDGDYIFLNYEIAITEDLDVQEAVDRVEAVIGDVQKRTDQLVSRRRDGLLGIYDRGSFDADSAQAIRNPNQVVALVMADIDHFKKVNDTYGHQVGDTVLRAVAGVLTEQCSGFDCVPYRYGGEELAVILTGNAATRVTEFAELVRADVEKLVFDSQPGLTVSVSLGIAVSPDNGTTVEDLIKKADRALYEAKDAGRNCVRAVE